MKDIILDRVNLEDFVSQYTDLANGRGKCPIHKGKNEHSLSIKGNYYRCFSCGSCGSVINFLSDIKGISYSQAIVELAGMCNLNPALSEEFNEKQNIIQKLENEAFQAKRNIDKAIDYLTIDRGLTPETIEQYGLGFSQSSVIIPIRNRDGETIAIAKRNFDGKPKYINSRNSPVFDKSATLFGMDIAKRFLARGKDKLYLVEGYFDCMIGTQQGLATCAYMGDEVTKDQIKLLSDLIKPNEVSIVLAPDNDDTGKRRIPRVRQTFKNINNKLNVFVLIFPENIKDFGDCKQIDISSFAIEHIDLYCLKDLLNKTKSRESEYHVVSEFMVTVTNPLIQSDIAQLLSVRWNKSIDEIKAWFKISAQSEDLLLEFKTPTQALHEYAEILHTGVLKCGYQSIDNAIGGFRRGEVLFLGGYSGTSKTFWACEMALRFVDQGLNVLFLSLEMPAGGIIERMAANLIGTDTRSLSEGLRDGSITRLYQTVSNKINKHLRIIDRAYLSIDDVDRRVKIANTVFDAPVDVVIIDYLQNMKGTQTYEELSETAKKFKKLVLDNNVFCICLSQLNRGAETYKRNSMKFLKGAGDIEATGDWVLMLYRPGDDPSLDLVKRTELLNTIIVTLEKGRRGFQISDRELEFEFDPLTTRIVEKNLLTTAAF